MLPVETFFVKSNTFPVIYNLNSLHFPTMQIHTLNLKHNFLTGLGEVYLSFLDTGRLNLFLDQHDPFHFLGNVPQSGLFLDNYDLHSETLPYFFVYA